MACFADIRSEDVNEFGGIGDRMSINRLKLGAAAAIAAGTVIPFAGAPADASTAAPQGHSLHVIKTLSSNFVGPLQFAVSGRNVYVADSFVSALFRIGRSTPLATGPDPSAGGDIAGVAVDHGADNPAAWQEARGRRPVRLRGQTQSGRRRSLRRPQSEHMRLGRA